MMLASDDNVLAENKVLILYLLNKLDKRMTNDTLYRVVLSVEEMNYFYFQQFLLDLIENKYIVCHEDDSTYEMTDIGKKTLELVDDILPGIKKLKIDTALEGKIDDPQNKQAIISEFVSTSEAGFLVKCKIIENNQKIFEVQIQAPTVDEAKKISDKWENGAEEIFPKVLELFN